MYMIWNGRCAIFYAAVAVMFRFIRDAMKRYAASKDKNIHRLMQYAEQLRVKPKVLRYMEVLL